MRIKGCMEENKGIYGRIKGIFGSENVGIYAGPDTGGSQGVEEEYLLPPLFWRLT